MQENINPQKGYPNPNPNTKPNPNQTLLKRFVGSNLLVLGVMSIMVTIIIVFIIGLSLGEDNTIKDKYNTLHVKYAEFEAAQSLVQEQKDLCKLISLKTQQIRKLQHTIQTKGFLFAYTPLTCDEFEVAESQELLNKQ